MRLKIKVTKDVLRKSMLCGTPGHRDAVSENCAIAEALKTVFHYASVNQYSMIIGFGKVGYTIETPEVASNFINRFDALVYSPEIRLDLPETEFEITIPEGLVEEINIEDIKKSTTLELV